MRTFPTELPGVYEIEPFLFEDQRGTFVKIFEAERFSDCGLPGDFKEEYYTTSASGVLRGLHFQLPPHDYTKLVVCLHGVIFDVALDVRVGSPTFGQHQVFRLNGGMPRALYLPPGIAHGFYVMDGPALVLYKVTAAHAASHDAGIRWDSASIDWPEDAPILSARDKHLPTLAEFRSPFRFAEETARWSVPSLSARS